MGTSGRLGFYFLTDIFTNQRKTTGKGTLIHYHTLFGFRPTGSNLIQTVRYSTHFSVRRIRKEKKNEKKRKKKATNSYNNTVLIWNDPAWLIRHRPHKTGCGSIDDACSLAIAGDRRRTFLCRRESQRSPWEIRVVCCNLAAKRNQKPNAGKLGATEGVVMCWVELVMILIIPWNIPGWWWGRICFRIKLQVVFVLVIIIL